jgi:anti-anti-sigma factor
MSESSFKYINCPVLVIRITESQVMGDTVADTLRDELLSAYERSGAVHVIIDMARVEYLSSAGIRPLLALNRQVREREGRLILCKLIETVHGVFLATRLVSTSKAAPATFETFATVSEAVASLNL